jgi:hypothetical protein
MAKNSSDAKRACQPRYRNNRLLAEFNFWQ